MSFWPRLFFSVSIACCLLASSATPSFAAQQAAILGLAKSEQLQAQGKRMAALHELERVLPLVRGSGELAEAQVDGALGKAYLLLANPVEARKHLDLLLAYALEKNSPALESAARNDIGLVEILENQPQKALSSFELARQAARNAGLPLLFSRASLNASSQLLREGKLIEGRAFLDDAMHQLKAEDGGEEKLMLLLASGYQGLAQPGYEIQHASFRTLMEAVVLARQLELTRPESLALGGLGEFYVRQGRLTEALGLARRALFLAQQANAVDVLYRWHWLMARIHAQGGHFEEAMISYEQALLNLQNIRQDVMAELMVSRLSYRETVGPLYQEYVDLLLRQASSARESEQATLLIRARDTVEQLKTVELEDYFQDACVTSRQERKASSTELPAGTAVLYPILLPDRTEMLVSLPGGMQQISLKVGGKSLAHEVERFRLLLEKRTTREFMPHARQLHAWLMAPVEPILTEAKIDTLVWVPDGPLRGIPLAALHDGKQFVIERYAVAVAPGLSLVEELPEQKTGGKSLLGGITESVQNFPALPYVEPEVASIQSIYGGKAMTDAQFVIPAFEKELKNTSYSVIHIASHGQIESDPRKSFLLAYDGKITMDNLEGYMKYSRMREDAIDLLTLSACRTAAGDDRAALGLAGVAVKAGARSALATLWYVSDQASSLLVAGFYRVLAAGDQSKAQALRQAQRSVLADPRYRHPGYWSPFLLIGNWR